MPQAALPKPSQELVMTALMFTFPLLAEIFLQEWRLVGLFGEPAPIHILECSRWSLLQI